MRAAITGCAGFLGSHLAELLLEKGVEVQAVVAETDSLDHIQSLLGRIELARTDIRRYDLVAPLLGRLRADLVFHLAAVSAVPRSLQQPLLAYETNFTGTLHILEACRNLPSMPRIVCSSTAQVYDSECANGALSENTPLRPRTPYAASKLAAEVAALQYFSSFGLPVLIIRPFNCFGPRQSPEFACSDFAKQIAGIALGLREPRVNAGDISRERDFTDVRDAVQAFAQAAERGTPGEAYNVCSGKLHSLREVIDTLADIAGVSVTVEGETERMRSIDPARMIGDWSKLNRATGWEPRISFRQTLTDLLNYWKQRTPHTAKSRDQVARRKE